MNREEEEIMRDAIRRAAPEGAVAAVFFCQDRAVFLPLWSGGPAPDDARRVLESFFVVRPSPDRHSQDGPSQNGE